MPSATARIVVQATPQEKRRIAAKARDLGMTVSELMRSGAASFDLAPEGLNDLAREACESMARSMATIDAAMRSVAESNARIKAMEARAARTRAGSASS